MNEQLSEEFNQELLERLASEVIEELESCSVEDGINRYLNRRQPEITESTLKTYDKKLARFGKFLSRRSIEDLRELDARTLEDFENWRRCESSQEANELSTKTMRDEIYLLRDFIGYLEKINVVSQGLADTLRVPELSEDDGVRNIELSSERVLAISNHLRQYQYANLEHVIWEIKIETGRRTGGLISLDVDDVHLEGDDSYINFVHRPPETRLKNGQKSEGPVSISEETAQIIQDFIETNRLDISDTSGRRPLLATNHGRISKSTFRRYLYKWSRPCKIGKQCPHERDPETCQAAQSANEASKCPSSRSPHAVRHGYITKCRQQGIPLEVISDRCDASEEVIRKHYDESTEEDRLRMRQQIIDDYSPDNNGGGYL